MLTLQDIGTCLHCFPASSQPGCETRGVWALDKRNGYVSMDDDEGRRVLAEEHSLDNVLQDRLGA